MEVFRNGDEIFPAMMETIASAERRIDLVTYVYWTGDIAQRMAHTLADRARDGVRVRVILDAVGSMAMDSDLVDEMKDAGCEVELFRAANDRPSRMHHRTHRKLLIVDERVAMTGGVGIAEEWQGDARNPDEWRDTHFRLRGPIVRQMGAAFVEHWVECGHPSVCDGDTFPDLPKEGDTDLLMLRGSSGPFWHDVGLAMDAMLRSAERRIRITTAYFVPGERMLELMCAAPARGVEVELLLPGTHLDNRVTHLASADEYERMLECGVTIRHYEQTMLHAKVLTIDGELAMFGSANVDERSMRHNEELSIVAFDPDLVAILDAHYEEDITKAEVIDLERWRDRPIWKKWAEAVLDPFEDWL
ncbi:Cardiolipin synthetase [Euzebya pacifica]|uniref:Cardiolipin synthetase n=1 Tax=Euzebya pacifica TaxID=1608957 RepID=A0A346XVX5_9ACTN|nr:phospholipase D-like domain-containing protein [Euzebya pacifica]AXV06372.1 Cardiolipin synthetase [Euzebya pacifica]